MRKIALLAEMYSDVVTATPFDAYIDKKNIDLPRVFTYETSGPETMRRVIVNRYRSNTLQDVWFGEKSSESPFKEDPSTYSASRFASVDWREVHSRRKFHSDMQDYDRGGIPLTGLSA